MEWTTTESASAIIFVGLGSIAYVLGDQRSYADPMIGCGGCLHLPDCPLYNWERDPVRDMRKNSAFIDAQDLEKSSSPDENTPPKSLLYTMLTWLGFIVVSIVRNIWYVTPWGYFPHRRNVIKECRTKWRCQHTDSCNQPWRLAHRKHRCSCEATQSWSSSAETCRDNPERETA